MNEFVDFNVDAPQRFGQLQTVFEAIKHDKDQDAFRPDEDWVEFFDADARSRFNWPPAAERSRWLDWFRSRPVIETPTESAAGQRWNFFAMIDAFRNGEYQLLSCQLVAPGQARLEFRALAYPYGGIGCMIALIESFGFKVTAADDGTGLVSFE